MKYCASCMAYVDTEIKVCGDTISRNGRSERTTEKHCKKCGLFIERVTMPIYEPFMGAKK